MATINKKLIHFEKLTDFQSRLAVGDILNYSIVCIKDAKLIWTHGTYYGGASIDLSGYLTAEEIAEVYATIEDLDKKQDEISDLGAIRSGAEKGATALQSYMETDPVFSASEAAGITASDIVNWNSKTSNVGTVTGVKINGTVNNPSSGVVDLGTVITAHQDISGKLDAAVAEDVYLTKSDAADTYLGKDDKAASASVADSATKASKDGSGNVITTTYATKSELSGVQSQIDSLVGGDASSAIESFNEIVAFLDGVEDAETLEGIIAGINTEVAAKANKSEAITGITRNGTTFTATRADGSTFTFTQQDSDTTYSSKAAASGGTDVSLVTTGEKYTWNAKQNAISDLSTIRSGASKGATAVQPSSLADVATSGSYNDLSDKPSIPSETTVSGWGFTKNTGTYSKPSTGIPKTDLASDVQTSLGKADTALQSYTEKYTGTITGIKMNGSSKGTSGVVDLGTVITAHQDISGKQDKLVSGTSIKTINGTSLLGSGNMGLIWATATTDTEYPSVTIK